MYSAERTNQGGSVAVFLIVSVVLAAAVIGGVYFVQQRGAHVRTNEPIARQDAAQKQQDDQAKTDADKQKADQEAAKRAEDEKKQQIAKDEAAKKAEEQKKAEAEKQQQITAQQQEQAAAREGATAIPQTSTAPQASKLPQTGPEDTFPQVLAGATLLAILLAYLKSYRHRFGSLLR